MTYTNKKSLQYLVGKEKLMHVSLCGVL